MKRFLSAHTAALALLLLTGMGVHANPLPAALSWSYNFTPGASSLAADAGTGGNISFTNETTKTAIGDSTVVATNLRVASTASAGTPDTLTLAGGHGNYSLTLALATTDDTGLHQASLTFHGQVSGTFSHDSANLNNIFGANSTQTATLGAYTFTVAMNSFTPPGPPGQTNAGSIAAFVTITPAGTPVPTEHTPEPGTIVLAGMGLSAFGGAAWRKRRQARLALAA